MKILPLNAKKGGVVSDLIGGTANLIILVVISLVVVSTLLGANLLGANTDENRTAGNLSTNFTAGINNVATRIPTILLIAAVVLLFGVLVLLVAQARRMGIGSTGSL